jgi:mannose-6-phosphate isomerase-like protein (cupin superfamily)
MALKPGAEIGEEIHNDRDQFFRVEKGKVEVWIDGTSTKIESDMALSSPPARGTTSRTPAGAP